MAPSSSKARISCDGSEATCAPEATIEALEAGVAKTEIADTREDEEAPADTSPEAEFDRILASGVALAGPGRPIMICINPLIVIFDGLLTKAECTAMIATARPDLERSLVVGTPGDPSSKISSSRTSESVSIDAGSMPRSVVNKVGALLRRLPTLQPNTCAEINKLRGAKKSVSAPACTKRVTWDTTSGSASVIRYRPGQHFLTHVDPIAGCERNRMATLIVCLGEPKSGGATYFPQARSIVGHAQPGDARAAEAQGIHVPQKQVRGMNRTHHTFHVCSSTSPTRRYLTMLARSCPQGRALLFWSVDDSSNVIANSKHGGEAVGAGEKVRGRRCLAVPDASTRCGAPRGGPRISTSVQASRSRCQQHEPATHAPRTCSGLRPGG
ncbi:unnamed protein product [Pedinophyceae sp. YPF-701]|nr:unnamed protein product [Pedinophyceae sp. YPF-701]